MRLPLDEVVNLQQVETLAAQQPKRALDLGDASRPAGRPHLGGDPEFVAHAEVDGEVADGSFGSTVHGRGIDHASAELDEAPQHVALRPALPRIADVERLPGAETDGGDGLAAGRNRARER